MPRGMAMALAALLLAQPVGVVDLARVTTIPKGHIDHYQIPIGDLDHDGRKDLAFEQSLGSFSPNIWENWGSNSYQPVRILEEGCGPAVEGDPDQDGLSDLLCAWGPRAFLLESRSATTFPSRTVWEEPLGGFPGLRGYFEDADQDGRQEMWIIPNNPEQIEVWENRGNDAYTLVALLTDPLMYPGTAAFGDFDSDGRIEIATGGSSNFVHVWENTADDVYALVSAFQIGDSSTPIVVSAPDLDEDGKPEFLVGGATATLGHAVTTFEASGDNTYAPIWKLRGEGAFANVRIVVGEVDGGPGEEFVVQIPGGFQIYEAVGDDDFGLIGTVPSTSAGGDFAIALADLNGNGVDELVFNGVFDGQGKATQIFIEELADLLPPVFVPAWFPRSYGVPSGQPLQVQAELFNRTDAVRTVDVWAEVYRGTGQGGPQGPLLRRDLLASQVPLAPHQSVTRRFSLVLPAPLGPYTLQLKVGTFPAQVTDTRWFTVVVGPAGS